MEIMESLTEQDKNLIIEYINDNIEIDRDHYDLNHILRFWAAEKEDFFHIFGDKLILTKKVSYEETNCEISKKLFKKIYQPNAPGYNFYDNCLEVAGKSCNFYVICSCFTSEALISNKYQGTAAYIVSEEGEILFDVNPGMKVSKILKKFSEAFNIEGYEDFRIAHSMCLNTRFSSGELCLSIHPLDYMTMSDNNYDWSSCMSWRENGEYRQGTVEMMNSNCVIIAYLKSKKDMPIHESLDTNEETYFWNNKKWRQLYIVTPDIIMGIKQYPDFSDTLDRDCLSWLKDLFNGKLGNYMDSIQETSEQSYRKFKDEKNNSIYIQFYTNKMYNDVYGKRRYYLAKVTSDDYIDITFSGESECMKCGKLIDENIPADTLICPECGNFVYCEYCDEIITDSENTYYVDGYRICEGCWENYTTCCEICEDDHFTENMYMLHLKLPDGDFWNSQVYICDHCFKEKYSENWSEISYDAMTGNYYVTLDTIKSLNLLRYGFYYKDIPEEVIERLEN